MTIDLVDKIMAYEQGEMDAQETVQCGSSGSNSAIFLATACIKSHFFSAP